MRKQIFSLSTGLPPSSEYFCSKVQSTENCLLLFYPPFIHCISPADCKKEFFFLFMDFVRSVFLSLYYFTYVNHKFLQLIQCIRKHEIKPSVLKPTRVRAPVSPESRWGQMKWRRKDNQLQQDPGIRDLSQCHCLKKQSNLEDFQFSFLVCW